MSKLVLVKQLLSSAMAARISVLTSTRMASAAFRSKKPELFTSNEVFYNSSMSLASIRWVRSTIKLCTVHLL